MDGRRRKSRIRGRRVLERRSRRREAVFWTRRTERTASHLARDRLLRFLLHRLQQLALDPVLRLRLQVRPQRHLVLRQDAPEEDAAHLAVLDRRGRAKRAHELQAEHVRLRLALVEDLLALRPRRVVDGREPAEELLERGERVHVQDRLDVGHGGGGEGGTGGAAARSRLVRKKAVSSRLAPQKNFRAYL